VLVSTILGVALVAASACCTGQPVSDSSGPLYPNGRRLDRASIGAVCSAGR